MDNQKTIIEPLSEQQLEALQKESPDVHVGTVTQAQLDEAAQLIKEIKEDEEFFPILKRDEDLQLFRDKMDFERYEREYQEKLELTPLKAAISDWLGNLSDGTRKNYAYYISNLIKRGVIHEYDGNGNVFTLGHFRYMRHNRILDHIKKLDDISEGTRQLYCAVYISFTAYLERLSQGWIRKAQPSTLAASPTFFQLREKCATNALTLSECHRFIDTLSEMNQRDSIIARCLLHGAKRISEVISITLSQIDWEKSIIRFKQSKTGGTFREIPITYPDYFMLELKDYIDSTADKRKDSQHVFITRNGKAVTRLRLNYAFDKASTKAKLKTRVTPHVLRATWVTLVRNQGASDSEIMQVTGHRNNKMVLAYDKTSDEQNITKKLTFI